MTKFNNPYKALEASVIEGTQAEINKEQLTETFENDLWQYFRSDEVNDMEAMERFGEHGDRVMAIHIDKQTFLADSPQVLALDKGGIFDTDGEEYTYSSHAQQVVKVTLSEKEKPHDNKWIPAPNSGEATLYALFRGKRNDNTELDGQAGYALDVLVYEYDEKTDEITTHELNNYSEEDEAYLVAVGAFEYVWQNHLKEAENRV